MNNLMIRWDDTFLEQVRSMTDDELLRSYQGCSEAGDPVADAYAEELERRGLDL